MKKVTFSFDISGKSQEELEEKIKDTTSKFFDIDPVEIKDRVNYEMDARLENEIYTAKVVAWIRK